MPRHRLLLACADPDQRCELGQGKLQTTVTGIGITSATPESVRDTAAARWSQAVHVPVTFRTTHVPDITIHAGAEMAWGHLLVRSKAADPWRIIDQGAA